jgi:hypothetical protein
MHSKLEADELALDHGHLQLNKVRHRAGSKCGHELGGQSFLWEAHKWHWCVCGWRLTCAPSCPAQASTLSSAGESKAASNVQSSRTRVVLGQDTCMREADI